MNILTVEGLTKGYGERNLFENLQFAINDGDRIGLIGINGTGKSTLLKTIAGVMSPDAGTITTNGAIRIEFMAQSLDFEEGATVLSHVFSGDAPEMILLRRYEELAGRLQHAPDDAALLKSFLACQQEMDRADAWDMETEAKRILTQLGIQDFEADVETLSGGQRRRLAMAGALIRPADLLILDEPTNHIDDEAVTWLESHLLQRKGALLMVTHDRYLLDRVATHMFELYGRGIQVYEANYSGYLEEKTAREVAQRTAEQKRQNLIRRELAWIRRGAQARSTKQKARLDRFEKLMGQEGPESARGLNLTSAVTRLGKTVIELEHVSKGFDQNTVIDDFSYVLLRDDRIGITGPNGAGKTTLLNLISGALAPDGGTVQIGKTVVVGVFRQEHRAVDETLTVLDSLREVAEYVQTGEGRFSAAQMLEQFLFSPDMQHTPVNRLSGGERRRLELLKVLMTSPNVLLLDEPTNDLDLETLTLLEAYLDGFEGAVVAVSHDRYFLDRVANRMFAFGGDGSIRQFEGGYTDYLARRTRGAEESATEPQGLAPERIRQRGDKFSYREQQEFDAIEDVIAGLEMQIAELQVAQSERISDYQALQGIQEELDRLEADLERTLARWAELTERFEAMQENRS